MNVLILGANGMLGSAFMRVLAPDSALKTWGTVRMASTQALFPDALRSRLIYGVDVMQASQLERAFDQIKPELVINCIGLVKQDCRESDSKQAIAINALLPHQLAKLCEPRNARLIHISTDCVFVGDRGDYRETDPPDAEDLYGRSKLLGELNDPNTLTLRTSIIGHELVGTKGLLEWFLAQEGSCPGYTKAVFSGLPTVVLAQLVRDTVIPRPDLTGVYHVSAEPISKYNLLKAIATQYGKVIDIVPSDALVIDRSLNSERFSKQTGWVAPSWDLMIKKMHSDRAQYV